MADISRVIRAFYGAEWAILPSKLEEIESLLHMKASGSELREELRARYAAMSPPPDHSAGQIAVLNLFGTISQRMNALSEFSGGTSTEMFTKAFIEARDNPSVSAIVINADTPGGTVPGVPELSNLIYEARDAKPIITVVNPMMASAGLWIGSAASEIVAIPSATSIGSLGVLTMHTDESALREKAGLKTTIIQSTQYKAEGNPYEPLSDEAKAFITDRVLQIHNEFVDAVARNRGVTTAKVNADFGKGRTFRAEDALKAGIIDRVATLDTVLTELGAGTGSTSKITATVPARVEQAKGINMNPKIKLGLVRAGLCGVTADEKTLDAALSLHCEANGIESTDEAKVLASFGTSGSPVSTTTTSEEPLKTVATGDQITGQCMTVADLISTVKLSGIDPQRQLDLIQDLTPKLSTEKLPQILDAVNAEARKGQETAGHSDVSVKTDSTDKFTAAARDAILARAYGGSNLPSEVYDYKKDETVEYKPGKAQIGLQSLPKLAESCLIQCGVPFEKVRNLSSHQIAQIVMDRSGEKLSQMGFFASSDGPAFNVSGMFSNILLDASNVMLRRSYTEAPASYAMWMRQGPSVADFKTVNKVIAGELGDPKAVPEDGEFEESTLSDSKETYKLTVWGEIFSHSWQLVVNDQLNSFTEIPMKMGRAMRRKQNRLAYQVLKDNPTMSDTGALFNSTAITTAGGHDNIVGGATSTVAEWVTALNTATQQMAEQRGLDTANGAALNLMPQYVIFPPAKAGIVRQLLGSTSSDATNPNITNIWQGGLTPVQEAELGAAGGGSDLITYVAASSSDVDTIEYAFLQGLEAPVIEQETSFTSLGMKQRIYQAFAVAAIDHRGLQRLTGA